MLQGSIRSIEEQLRLFNVVPSIEGRSFGYQLGYFFLFVFLVGMTLGIFQAVFGSTNRIANLSAVLCALPFGAIGWKYYSSWADLAIMRKAKEDDDDKLAPVSETYLGIAYCNGIWGYRGDISWDRGYLVFTESGIQFAGLATFFDLPYARILDIRINYPNYVLGGGTPRVYVDWKDWSGITNTFCLEVRLGDNRGELQVASHKLADELCEKWQQGIHADYRKDVELPFRSSTLDFSFGPDQEPIQFRERNKALLWAVIFLALTVSAVQIFDKVLGFDVGMLSGLFGVMSAHVHSAVVLSLVKKRRARLNGPSGSPIPSHS